VVTRQDDPPADAVPRAVVVAIDRFRAALQHAPIGMALVSLAPETVAGTVAANAALTRMLGTSEEALRRTPLLQWSHPEDVAIGAADVESMLRGEQPTFCLERRWVGEDGTALSGRLYGFVVPNTDPPMGIFQLLDVTEQRASAEELRASEARFRRMAEQSRSVIYTYSLRPPLGLDYVSPSIEAMTGYRPQELYDDETVLPRLFHPDSAQYLQDGRELLDHWTPVRWVHRDGRDVWTEQHLVRVTDDAGRTIAVQGEARDVTHQHEAEFALRQQAAVVDSATDAIITIDAEWHVRTWNDGAQALYGYTAEEMVGNDVSRLVPPQDEAARVPLIAQVVAGKPVAGEVRRIHKDGRLIDVAYSASPLRNEAGGAEGMSVIARDITATKRRTLELAQLAAVIDSSGEAIFALSLAGTVLTWNRGAEVTYGFSAAEAVGADVRALTCDDGTAGIEDAVRRAGGGKTIQTAGRAHHKDGHVIDVAMTFSPIATASGVEGVAVVSRDISDVVEADAAREQLQAELAQTQRLESAGQLAGGMAHDFNNLLAVVNLYGEFALDALEAGHPARTEVERMRAATQRAAELTGHLLTFSRRQVIRAERLDAGMMLRDLEHVLDRMVGPAVELHLETAGTPVSVMADSNQFEQVILNLVTNARDAMPDGGTLTITASVAPADDIRKAEAVITIADTGEGMTEEVRGRIFEPFFTTKPRGEGTGLGLATVYGIVVAGDGRIKVYSQPGHGARFVIRLPVAGSDPPRPAAAEPRGRDRTSPARLQHGTVMLVEDDEEVGQLAARVLRSHGYDVIHLTSAQEGIDLLADAHSGVDLLLTDVVMPGITGPQLAGRISALRPGLPVIFMSGYPDAMEQIPADAIFISKPFSGDHLADEVGRALRAT
jgi:two-component system cell cycle sensor histidine kinase/response regulator CckA